MSNVIPTCVPSPCTFIDDPRCNVAWNGFPIFGIKV